ncbi:6-pyruvoyl trahydropterin synthase family protein [Methylococcus capsulatus]|jgi:6-pyruvoyltetrahydropterin/6-carboxytetrahydropterin synthase|uniref:6-carboxy-5,6,7,8-tetrahydropterin synthase n=2 Tax=Methylococcus capsulatus TaxID=414 RepID=Q604L2_METCA|nr:6-carboxytetrahydropterin synthase [Methylococcus capsulatus]AAU91432.1 putative 6-pyruvoyl tetrahydropterin synthase [Methylococcus capsulatus str. Bath]QXP86906.1 6-carboxytetrahydropterin synthase [Methylococcus capsulatus]QXP91747.1 6-carboxytetrahydropterin synthase [Methylococcus capsulatus]QXP93414.1 6-carboxytetrahydropterin synthase [Methylococcus capsulatus]UQN11887.1 6-carboxytetrahydropterin synthase [Methylococcus capsulatus]
MYSVTKEIFFCYGHRLMHHSGKCRHLHGHSVRAAITVSASDLNFQGMVCDFADISAAARDFIDTHLDHNLLLHRDDPLLPLLQQAGERVLALEQHPTAEALAEMIYRDLRRKGFAVQNVTLWETSSACASYREGSPP